MVAVAAADGSQQAGNKRAQQQGDEHPQGRVGSGFACFFSSSLGFGFDVGSVRCV